jgi:integrase
MFTGSRHSEVLTAKWTDFDLSRTPATWTKPSHSNKLKEDVIVPLNRRALSALASITRTDSEYLFPGERKEHLWSFREAWYEIRKAAKLPKLHIHDIRHHFGNTLVSEGATLYEVQKWLGHVNPTTTQRYAKIADETLKQATERFDKAFSRATATVQ